MRGCLAWRVMLCRLMMLCLMLLAVAGCQQEMGVQPSLRPLEASAFFADMQSARKPPEGTIARGQLRADREFYTGMTGAYAASQDATAGEINEADPALTVARDDLDRRPYVKEFPLPVDAALLERGHERFRIYCEVCHDPLGTGHGIVVQRGFTPPPTWHSDRLRKAPPGYFFDVITRGYGSMADYRAQVSPRDRWAIVAYLRALQLSQNARLADLPEEERLAARAGLHGEKKEEIAK